MSFIPHRCRGAPSAAGAPMFQVLIQLTSMPGYLASSSATVAVASARLRSSQSVYVSLSLASKLSGRSDTS